LEIKRYIINGGSMGKIAYEKPILIRLQEVVNGQATIPPFITPPPLPPAYPCGTGSSPGNGIMQAGCLIGYNAATK
jgi:hypothetical protein